MWQACIFWTYNCYKTRIEWKINSSIRRKKNRDILRYEFRIAIRYKFFVYCDIPIYRYIVTPLGLNQQCGCSLLHVNRRLLYCRPITVLNWGWKKWMSYSKNMTHISECWRLSSFPLRLDWHLSGFLTWGLTRTLGVITTEWQRCILLNSHATVYK